MNTCLAGLKVVNVVHHHALKVVNVVHHLVLKAVNLTTLRQ